MEYIPSLQTGNEVTQAFRLFLVPFGLDYIIKNQLFEYSAEVGKRLKQSLIELPIKFPHIYKAVRGQGLLVGVELASKGRLVRDTLIREGVLVEIQSAQMGEHISASEKINQTIKAVPPLTLPQEKVSEIVKRFERAAEALTRFEKRTQKSYISLGCELSAACQAPFL
ncbi:hypothetical protein LC613_39780 [Nostoc sphaeroides CHAB 2801]|uniref:hypothetical protein n=1 Tax=Nostoc sphaeroides TaxID=446679 RepID=UPI001E55733E|nr:hypothetical protein [Nostoc sphaeroides]MCC5633587.1 hypothetical protein [Nostoc sphaeroides CHAB 2801]